MTDVMLKFAQEPLETLETALSTAASDLETTVTEALGLARGRMTGWIEVSVSRTAEMKFVDDFHTRVDSIKDALTKIEQNVRQLRLDGRAAEARCVAILD